MTLNISQLVFGILRSSLCWKVQFWFLTWLGGIYPHIDKFSFSHLGISSWRSHKCKPLFIRHSISLSGIVILRISISESLGTSKDWCLKNLFWNKWRYLFTRDELMRTWKWTMLLKRFLVAAAYFLLPRGRSMWLPAFDSRLCYFQFEKDNYIHKNRFYSILWRSATPSCQSPLSSQGPSGSRHSFISSITPPFATLSLGVLCLLPGKT